MPAEEPSSADNPLSVERISAPLGTEEYERQFAQQSSSAVQKIAQMPIVRIVFGLLTIIYCLMVFLTCIEFVRSQFKDGFQAWELLYQVGYMMVMWWVISMQGRIALYGEFGAELGLFAPRQSGAN